MVSDSALRAGISLCVSAPTREELEARVERVRSEHGWVELHRPGGDQLRLFIGHLPAQRSQVPDYEDQLTPERLGELAPIATHAVGADVGPYIGHTLNGTRRPVLFDPAEGVRADGASAILVAGAPCASKTRCMELIMYQAFLAGSRIYDIDPRGDHDLERLPGVAEHAEIVELSSRGRYRGMLDPLRVGTEDTRAELACRFLSSLLPDSVPPAWEREIRRAVQSVAGRATACCGEVAAELARGDEDAREAGLELAARAAVGLAGLCFGAADRPAPHAGSAAVTVLRIPELRLAPPGAAPTAEERVGLEVLRLLAIYVSGLAGAHAHRHAVLGVEEASALLPDLPRLGRSENVTPLLSAQVLRRADGLDRSGVLLSRRRRRRRSRRVASASARRGRRAAARHAGRVPAGPLSDARLRRARQPDPDRSGGTEPPMRLCAPRRVLAPKPWRQLMAWPG